MDKDQGYPMFDMPGGFRAYYNSSSSIESSSSSLHTTRGLEDIQTIPESTLFDDDGSQMDANLQPTSSVDKCRHKEEDFSMSLRKQLYYQGERIRELKTKLRYQGESFQEQQRILQQQYEDLHRTALNGVVKDFQAQKDALANPFRCYTKLHLGLEQTHAKERAAHQEQLYNEQRLATQRNHSQLEEFQRRLELELQSQMEKMSTSRAANLEARVQEEVTRLRESLQAEKEREMAKLEQEVTRLRESLQVCREGERDGKLRATTPSHEKSSYYYTPARWRSDGLPRRASYIAFLTTLPVLLLILLGPLDRLNFHKPVPLLSMLLKGLGEPWGISTRTRLIGVAVDEMKEMEDHQERDRQALLRGVSRVEAAAIRFLSRRWWKQVTRGVEAALHNVLADGKMIPSRSGRHSRRRRVCEDEEVKLEKESEPAVHRDFILVEVRCLFKEKLGITQDLDFIMHCPAAAEDVHAYEYEDGFGPDRNNLSFDLTQNYSSPWNTYILKLLCQELQARCKEENWPIKRGDNYIMEILREHYKRLRTVWRNAQPKLTSKGVLETPTETEAHLVEGRIQMGKDSRQANRRRNKYHRRVMVLDEMVKSKSEVQDDDLQSWKWLRSLIKTLGEHGMSSEESSVENGVENVLRVKNMPWRRNIDQELEIVDFQRLLDTDIFSPQGSKPLTRKRSPDNPSTTRDAVKALPLALYDGAWFAQLTERQIEALNVPQQTFSWMKVVVA
ncbi:hypothetical protein EDD16DRAFT_1792969 [Pisolithus croceorrhizus]|nr:hypothetical protein EDD16DRAFT_1792969 [Pisolithus croceorrhizus]